MKSYDKMILLFALIFIVILFAVNLIFPKDQADSSGLFKVETNRVVQEITAGNEININNYYTITGICDDRNGNLNDSDLPYVIREINGRFYRIEYRTERSNNGIINFVNGIFILLFSIILGVLLYIRQTILKPFNEISELPYMLAKGNLSVPLKETRSRYFGKFIWGLDMLREELENSRQRELKAAKEEKTAILSISHDVKTPLAAIKLYAKAISNNLYPDENKRRSAAENINLKADEIECYVNELIGKINNDFMEFSVKTKEVYLSVILERIKKYYSEKLKLLGTNFIIADHTDCLLICDPDRMEEVLQNIMENAIKYGDGKFIRIDISDEEYHKLIVISNSGCTLPDTELSHIFDSFWRGSNAGDKAGNGLGLYICRRLMNEMNGDIFAEIKNRMMCVTVVCSKLT